MSRPTDEPPTAAGETSSRAPVFAGRFYPADAKECRRAAVQYLHDAKPQSNDSKRWMGGIVPHAGWVCSAAIAAQTIAVLGQGARPDVVVVFGAIHTPLASSVGALDVHHRWQTPGSELEIAGHLQARLIELPELFAADVRFHEREHAIEVELPLIHQAWSTAAILPVEVPVIAAAVGMGQATAQRIIAAGLTPVYLASSDMTHYGPAYRFTPAGIGPAALTWAKDNDRRLLQLVTDMQPERIVPEVRSRLNACGGGAIAAMLAACREHGASTGRVLRHASSYETLAEINPQPPTDAVGYASVVIA